MKKKRPSTHPASPSFFFPGNFSKSLPLYLSVGLGLLGLWQFHSAELHSRFNLVPGTRGDNRLVTALLEYDYQAFFGAGSFLSPAFYYPTPRTAGYADIFLSHALLYGFLRRFGIDIFSCYQACLFLFNALNYLCGLWMLRGAFGFGLAASACGAFFFAYNAPKFNQLVEPQLQCLFWLALAVGLVVRFVQKSKSIAPREAFFLLAGAGLCVHLQLLTAYYLSWFFLFWTFLFMVLVLLRKSTRDFLLDIFRRNSQPLAGATGVFLIGLIPFLWIYLPVLEDLGGKSYDEVRLMLPQFWSLFWMGPRHSWWGWLWDASPAIRSSFAEEGQRLGYGIFLSSFWLVLTAAATMALLKNPSRKKKEVASSLSLFSTSFYGVFAALAVLATSLVYFLTMDYGGGTSPWFWVYQLMPGGQSVRAVGRFAILMALPLSILTAYVLEWLWKKTSPTGGTSLNLLKRSVVLLFTIAAVIEQISLPPYPAFDKRLELGRLEALSQKIPASVRVFYVAPSPSLPLLPPYSSTNLQIDAMLLSATRRIATLNGFSGHSPKDNWGLFKVRSPKYEQYVQDWINRHPSIGANAFRLEIDR